MKTVFSASRSVMSSLSRGLSVPGWTISVVTLSLAAWLAMLVLMGSMDEGPGTPLHGLTAYLIGWIVMLTAMMLPSELNYIGAFSAVLRARIKTSGARPALMLSFIAGYAIAWIGYGLAAYLLDWAVRAIRPGVISWDHAGPYLAGAVLIVAGLYQVSSLKHACLSGCRSPLSFFARYWKPGKFGSLVMGAHHGLVCVGCCWALMAVMFAVGVMSLTWMALLTVFMFAEKMLPKGKKLAIPIASFLWVMGIWIAVSPGTAPMLKNPMLFASLCNAL
jgi:predicted metal-binding membrane protein